MHLLVFLSIWTALPDSIDLIGGQAGDDRRIFISPLVLREFLTSGRNFPYRRYVVKLDETNNHQQDFVREQLFPELAKTGQVEDRPLNLPSTHTCSIAPLDKEGFPHQAIKVGRQKLMPLTIENFRYLLGKYGITVRYNLVKKTLETRIPQLVTSHENAALVSMAHIKSLVMLNGFSTDKVEEFMLAIADGNQYNPAATWIMSREWDGQDRLPDLCNTLKVKEGFTPWFKDILITRWLLSAVAAVFINGFKTRGVLTLQGPQGIGKTSWIQSLVDDPVLKTELVKIDHLLDVTSKDSVLGGNRFWITEIGELDASFRRDAAKLKGFITSDRDVVRVPYGRVEVSFPRRTVFAATVNEENFLIDKTGNNRFWTLPVVAIDFKHGIDMQQIFAQLKVKLDAGEQWWLTPEEEDLLDSYNESFKAVDLVEEMILAWLGPKLESRSDAFMSAADVLAFVKYPNINSSTSRDAGRVLRKLYGEPRKSSGKMGWDVYFRVDEESSLDDF